MTCVSAAKELVKINSCSKVVKTRFTQLLILLTIFLFASPEMLFGAQPISTKESMEKITILKRHLTLPKRHRGLSLNSAIDETLENQREIVINILNVPIQQGIAWSDLGPFDLVCSGAMTKTKSQDLLVSQIGPRTNFRTSSFTGNFGFSKLNRLGTQITSYLNIQKNPPYIGQLPYENNQAIFNLDVVQPLLKDLYFNQNNTNFISNAVLTRSVYYQTLFAISAQVLNTITAYWELRAAQDIYAISKKAVENFINLVQDTKAQIENNEFAVFEIEQPLSELNGYLAQLEAAEQAVYMTAKALLIAIGEDEYVCCVSSVLEELLVADDDYPLISAPDSIELFDELLCYTINYRADIVAQAIQILSTNVLLQGSKNQSLPAVNLMMQLQLTDYTTGNQSKKVFSAAKFPKPQNDLLTGITLSSPFCNSSAYGSIKRYSSLKYQQILQLLQLQQNAIEAVKIAWRNHKSLLEQKRFLTASVDNFEKILAAEKIRVDKGLSSLFEYIQYISQLITAEQQLIGIKKQIAQSIANIRHLSGTLLKPDTTLDRIRIEDPKNFLLDDFLSTSLN